MFLSDEDSQTIVAQCTPHGSGAIALIRASGSDVFSIMRALCVPSSGKSIEELPTHTVTYGSIISPTEQIDTVLFFLMRGPRTFTGQDTIEISCHNNPFIIQKIIHEAIAHGARLAREGEFSRRAVLNGKIDLIQAEAINEVIAAQTPEALKISLAQLQGSLSHTLHQIEQDLLKALAFCQASFEFIEEENITFDEEIISLALSAFDTVKQLERSCSMQQQIRQGIRIALIGTVNAGKSSLFNTLLGKNRSIVTNIAGTTRDSIEAGLYQFGSFITLIDTAGLRRTDDIIEQMGIQRTKDEAHAADIILLIQDATAPLNDQEQTIYHELLQRYGPKIISVCTKSDALVTDHSHVCILTSSKTQTNIAALQAALEATIKQRLEMHNSPYLLTQRQQILIQELKQRLERLASSFDRPVLEYEIVAYELNDMLAHLRELTGKTISEEAMDAIFKTFCVGK